MTGGGAVAMDTRRAPLPAPIGVTGPRSPRFSPRRAPGPLSSPSDPAEPRPGGVRGGPGSGLRGRSSERARSESERSAFVTGRAPPARRSALGAVPTPRCGLRGAGGGEGGGTRAPSGLRSPDPRPGTARTAAWCREERRVLSEHDGAVCGLSRPGAAGRLFVGAGCERSAARIGW